GGVFVNPALAPPGGLGVHQDAADVAVERALVLDAVPGQIRLGQGRLQEVLGVGAVPGQQIRDPQECARPFGDIARELLVSVRRHAPTLCRGGAGMTIEGRAERASIWMLWAGYRNHGLFLVDALPLRPSIEYRLRNDPTTSVDI